MQRNRGDSVRPIRKAGWSVQWWPVFSYACVGGITAFYSALIISNIVYLGWNDALYFFTRSRIWQRFFLTTWTAGLSTCIAMALALPAGYALSRLSLPWPNVLNTIIDLPVMVPPAAVGVFLFGVVGTFPVKQFSALTGLEFGHHTAGVILCQVAVTVAFAVRLIKVAFDSVPPRFELVARSLGASWPKAVCNVTLPLAKGGILAAVVIVFARAAAEWEALMLFVGATQGSTDTLPFAIYLDWNGGLMGWVVSMSLLCILTAVLAMGGIRLIGGRSYVW